MNHFVNEIKHTSKNLQASPYYIASFLTNLILKSISRGSLLNLPTTPSFLMKV